VAKISIVIPTYNEVKNLEKLVTDISNLNLDSEIIIVDDDSPDGTGRLADDLKNRYESIKVIHRKERGLASAVVEGFKAAGGRYVGVMDADFSHPIEKIPALIQPLNDDLAEIVIGSRYVEGGNIIRWNMLRKITSKGAILLARPLSGVKDSVSGFFFLEKGVLDGVNLNPKGYKIGLEVIVKGKYKRLVEIPYTFTNRKIGKSKLSLREYINYILHLLALYQFKLKQNFSA
jgi:dolichol-phosphate mannosyltransferase